MRKALFLARLKINMKSLSSQRHGCKLGRTTLTGKQARSGIAQAQDLRQRSLIESNGQESSDEARMTLWDPLYDMWWGAAGRQDD